MIIFTQNVKVDTFLLVKSSHSRFHEQFTGLWNPHTMINSGLDKFNLSSRLTSYECGGSEASLPTGPRPQQFPKALPAQHTLPVTTPLTHLLENRTVSCFCLLSLARCLAHGNKLLDPSLLNEWGNTLIPRKIKLIEFFQLFEPFFFPLLHFY